MTRVRHSVLAGIIGTGVIVLALVGAGSAGGTGDLVGKQLNPGVDLETGVGNLLAGLLGGGQDLEGRLNRVIVLSDTADRIVFEVTYEGLVGKRLWGELLDDGKRRQRDFDTQPTLLGSTGGTAQIEFSLHSGEAAQSGLSSSFLRLNVGEPNRSTAGLIRVYELDKTWVSPQQDNEPVFTPDEEPVAVAEGGQEVVLNPIWLGDPLPAEPTPDPAPGGGTGAGRPGGKPAGTLVFQPQMQMQMAYILPKVDLYRLAESASWYSGSGVRLPFNGPNSDSRGFVIKRDKIRLADGKDHAAVLQTHPEWKGGGRIFGVYLATIPQNAKTFNVGLGFLPGATGSDGVTFVVSARYGNRVVPILQQTVGFNQVVQKSAPLAKELLGKQVQLRLEVQARASAGRDWSVWIWPRIN